MSYASISMYLSALENPKVNLRTLKQLKVVCDSQGEMIFRAHRNSISVLVEIGGSERALRLLTSPCSKKYAGQLLEGELLVGAEYFDVIVEEPFVCRKPKGELAVGDLPEEREFLRPVLIGGRWGFVDPNGEVVIEAEYQSVSEFYEGRAVVEIQGMYGLIDNTGRVVIEIEYDELSYDNSSICYVDKGGLYGAIDRTGRVLSDTMWEWTSVYSNDLMLVRSGDKFGFVDMYNNVVIDLIYDDATSFDHNGYSVVKLDGKRYQIDKDDYRISEFF